MIELALATKVAGELVVDGNGELAIAAAGVAADQAAVLTRSTYAGVYRAFCAFLGPGTSRDELTRESVRAYRGSLEAAGSRRRRSPSISPRCARSPQRWARTTCITSAAVRCLAANRGR